MHRELKHLLRGLDAEMANGVEDPEHRYAKVTLPAFPSAFNAFEQWRKFLLPPQYHSHGDVYLGMDYTLLVQLLSHAVSDELKIVGRTQTFCNCFKAH